MKRLIASLCLSIALALGTFTVASGGVNNCHPAWKCGPPTPTPIVTPSPTGGTPTPTPASTPTGTYIFDDEFDGTSINPVWIRHFSCCGTLAGYDPTLATVANGVLSMRVVNRSGGWYGYLLDTKTTFLQKYGYFEARIKIPKGKGLWPAFWHYYSGSDEIDTMEICANPLGLNGGNDASLLHTTLHFSNGAQSGYATRTVDLSLDYHVYAVDWRAGSAKFYLDNNLVWSYAGSNVTAVAEPLIINLGVGGSWCSSPDSTTPLSNTMYVDYIRVKS